MLGGSQRKFVVATTEQHEAPALSAAPSVSIEARRRLAETLLNMQHTEAGRLALEQSAIERFDTPTEDAYLDDAKLLTAYWPMGPHRQMQ